VPNLIKQIYKAKIDGLKEIYGGANKKNFVDLLYVDDAAEAIIRSLMRYNQSEPLNIGSGSPIMIETLVEKISDLINFKGKIFWDTQKIISCRYLDTTKAKDILGFLPKVNITQGLKCTIEQYIKDFKKTENYA
jgi:GDP-L-fucose synthase